jgi:hypothetical protein
MLTLLPILYRSVALTAIPAPLERSCIAITLGTAVGTILLSFCIGLHDETTAEASEIEQLKPFPENAF